MHFSKRALAVVALLLAGAITTTSVNAASVSTPWKKAHTKIAFGASVWTTSTTGAALTFTVKGKSFAMWFTAGPKNGKVAVYVNGKRSRIVDQYSARTIRRAVSFTRAKTTNKVMVVALSTKNKKSKGTKVTVDAFSPNTSRCTKGCTKNPIPHSVPGIVEISGTDQVWYPSAVPAANSREWVVAIGSYVRGKDVAQIETAVPVIRAAACDQAKKVPRGVVILSFGAQRATGSNGFGTLISVAQIVATASAWATGLAECGTGPWEVSIGTSNSGAVTAHNGYMGGIAWAKIVAAAQAESDPRTIISGSVDLEPGWGPPGQARAWVDGYVRTTNARLWNFGSADGCPQTVSTDLTCNNGWTIDDVLWVSAHAGPNIYAMPQIHTKGGAMSRQWAVLAARALSMKMPMRLAALTVQTAACSQVKGGCPTTGISAWDGWAQLRKALDAIPSTAGMPLGAPMDIRWGWANGFVIPPPTTTTTIPKLAVPVFTMSSYSESVAQNSAITGYTISSSGGVVASYSISPEAPAGMSFSTSTGLLSGSPTTEKTATEYVVTATNASGSATRTFTLTVTLAVPAFTMSSYSESVAQNSAITGYTIMSSGGVVASYSISPAAPAGMSFSTSTGLLSGTPTTAKIATDYVVTATNASGSASRTFALTVT
jgi:hypothetical protein